MTGIRRPRVPALPRVRLHRPRLRERRLPRLGRRQPGVRTADLRPARAAERPGVAPASARVRRFRRWQLRGLDVGRLAAVPRARPHGETSSTSSARPTAPRRARPTGPSTSHDSRSAASTCPTSTPDHALLLDGRPGRVRDERRRHQDRLLRRRVAAGRVRSRAGSRASARRATRVVTGPPGQPVRLRPLAQGSAARQPAQRPVVYSTPLVAWRPAIGATAYEVQWSRTQVPVARARAPGDVRDLLACSSSAPGSGTTGSAASTRPRSARRR